MLLRATRRLRTSSDAMTTVAALPRTTLRCHDNRRAVAKDADGDEEEIVEQVDERKDALLQWTR